MNFASTERPWAGWSSLLGALALGGCVSPSVSRQEVDGLRAEVRTLQDQQRDQQRELARLRAEVKAQQASAPSARFVPAATSSAKPSGKPATVATAEAEVDAASSFPIPKNLRVVKLEPDAVEFNDDNTPQALAPRARHGGPAPAAALPTDTSLKEPVLADLAPQPVPDPAFLDVQYKVALTAPNAIDQLEAFAHAHPEHPSADNALFEAGLRAERAGDAARAAKDFDRAVREHPAGDTVADSLLHLAACDLQLNKTGAARQTLVQLSTQYPDSAQAEAARVRLADLPH